jgi:D-alanyl-D-alanine carboxypeptidase/D-alanyl-D-alanine-endopeptidase (penicillin-binding protein 4)
LILAPLALAQVGGLQAELDGALRRANLGSTSIGFIVIDPDTDDVLASYSADEEFIPASNQKLLTSGTALATLGPDYSFETQLLVDAERGNRLIVKGSGDPAFGDGILLEEMGMTVDDLLDTWASAWLNTVAGVPSEVVIDDRVFDREYAHESWPREQLNRWYCAEVGGLNFHTNCLALFLSPRQPGERPALRTEPSVPWLQISNRARSVKRGQHTPWASRAHETNDITIHGNVRYPDDPVLVTFHDPPRTFGRMLAERIAERAGKPAPPVRLATPEEVLVGQPVHVVRTRIETVLERCNTDSHNLYAECLIKATAQKATGQAGSWSGGAAIVRSTMTDRVGPLAADATVADGSGMSRDNKVTPRVLAEWLVDLGDDDDISEVFMDSLAEPGTGTLAKWFKANNPTANVYAKSGYLNGVSALSGYVQDPQTGKWVVVVTIANEWPRGVRLADVRDFQEKVFMAADEWVASNGLPALIPGGG